MGNALMSIKIVIHSIHHPESA